LRDYTELLAGSVAAHLSRLDGGVPVLRVRRRLARLALACAAAAPATALTALPSPPAAVGAVRSPAGCAPAPPYRYCQRYAYTGTDQSFTVPGGITSIRVLEWGAGGGGASGARPQFSAGAGGFTGGVLAVQPGTEFTVSVGQGGYASGPGFEQNVYGGGGPGGNGARPGATGGGMSALWAGGYGITPVLIAGGGGGASPGSLTASSAGPYPAVIGGGGGGGLSGGADGSWYSGQGGSQYSGGDPGAPGADCGASGPGGTAPTPGQQFYGGSGGGSDPAPPGPDPAANGGGGGGGGYYGGGGGRCEVDGTGFPGGDGGGGSGYIARVGVTRGYSLRGTNGTSSRRGHGAPPAAAAGRSRLYRPGIGWGGGLSGAGDGGNGQVVIEWGLQPRPEPVPRPSRRHPSRHPPGQPPVRRRPAPPPAGSGVAYGQALPRTGFPFLQVGGAAAVLIGLGILVTWGGGRRRRS
jgi:hypothetical protein